MHRPILALAVLFLLAACGIAVPADKGAYVGEWEGREMRLRISPEGRVAFKREFGASGTKSIDAPLQAFEGDDFVAGLGPMKAKFVVSVPPHEQDGTWKMTVDGVELTRVGAGDVPPR